MNVRILLLYILIFFTAYLLGKSFYFYKKHNVNPAAFLTTGNKKERILWSGLLLIFVLFAILIVLHALQFGIASFPEYNAITIFGILLFVAGAFVMALAQYQMGSDWRMGNDEQGNIKLVRKGIFKRSRNPIYLSIILLTFGLILLLHSFIAFLLWAILIFLFNEIIKTEEQFLTKKFGDSYLQYKKEVRRFI